jgi:hypothetical protein
MDKTKAFCEACHNWIAELRRRGDYLDNSIHRCLLTDHLETFASLLVNDEVVTESKPARALPIACRAEAATNFRQLIVCYLI